MSTRDHWLLASTFVAGVLLAPEPARAGSMETPSDSTTRIEMEKCVAIKRRYTDLARKFAEQARQVASDADRAELLVPAAQIPTRRWQAEYDRALALNYESSEISQVGDAAFRRCIETVQVAPWQLAPTRGRETPRSEAYAPRRDRLFPGEAP